MTDWERLLLAALLLIGSGYATAANSRDGSLPRGDDAAIWDDVAVIGDASTESAHVYRFDGTSWILSQTLQASDGVTDDLFGGAVDIWGGVIAVGAIGVNGNASSVCGAVYVFRFNGTSWVEEEKLEPDAYSCIVNNNPKFGASVAVFNNIVAVGAPTENVDLFPDTFIAGTVYVFRYGGSNWLQEGSIVSPDATTVTEFGAAIDVWNDRLIIGAPDGAGSAHIYMHNGISHWLPQKTIEALPGNETGFFGRDVAIWAGLAAVSSDTGWPFDCQQSCVPGESLLYAYDGNNWAQTAQFPASYFVDISGTTLAYLEVDPNVFTNDAYVRVVRTIRQDFTLGGSNTGARVQSLPKYMALWNGARCVPDAPGACQAGARGNDALILASTGYGASTKLSEFASPTTYQPGNVFIADTMNSRILQVNPDTANTSTVSTGGFMSAVRDVALDSYDNLVAIDTGVDVVFDVDPQTGIQTLISAHGLLSRPRAIAVEPDGNILVAEERQNIVVRIDPDTGVQSQINATTTFDAFGVATAIDDSIIATDRNGGRIFALDPVTGSEAVIASGLISPRDGDMDSLGRYVLAESGSARIVAVDPSSPGASPLVLSQDPQFIAPQDVSVEGDGMLLVTDSTNGLFRVDPTSGVATGIATSATGNFLGLTVLKTQCSDGLDNDGDGQVDTADPDCADSSDRSEALIDVITAQKNRLNGLDNDDWFGSGAAPLGDLNSDGIIDLAVGALLDDDGGFDRGAVYVLFLDSDGTLNWPYYQKISDTEGGFTGSLDDSDWFGGGMASLGDLDGDGVTDIAVGAKRDDDGGTDRGAVWVLFLNSDGTVKSHQKISDTAGGFPGILDDHDYFGIGVAALGDLDGDGIHDLAVGAELDDDGGVNNGAVWILFLNSDGTVKGHQKISDTTGNFTGTFSGADRFGSDVAGLGDLDDDGVEDLAVGARFDDDGGPSRGTTWVLFLNADGTVKSHQKISDTEGGFAGVLDDTDRFGERLSALGDMDGDGILDLAVAAPLDDDGGADRGAVWMLFLNSDGTVKRHQKLSDAPGGGFEGLLNDYDSLGFGLTLLGDLDGNGVSDLAVGAYKDDDGGANSGAMWINLLGNGAVCGDGLLQVTEQCDDGDTSSGDGCSRVCVLEYCGDGVTQSGLGETCDDGNAISGDGCTNACAVEFCGDGVMQPALGEVCDDGGNIALDGCDAACALESYIQVLGDATTGTIFFTVSGVPLSIATVDVLTLDQVADAIALEINNDSTLTILGITAQTDGNIVYTDGVLTDVTTTDPGLVLRSGLGVPPSADGDITLDGVVDVRDVLLGHQVLNNTATLDATQFSHGDVAPLNGGVPAPDGYFTLGDVLLIQRKALGVVNF